MNLTLVFNNLTEVHNLKESISSARKAKSVYSKMLKELDTLPIRENKDTIETHLLRNYTDCTTVSTDAMMRLDEIKENIEYIAVDETDYIQMLKDNVECTFKTMIENAMSDIQCGYSAEHYMKEAEKALNYRAKELIKINELHTQEEALAMVINKGLTSV